MISDLTISFRSKILRLLDLDQVVHEAGRTPFLRARFTSVMLASVALVYFDGQPAWSKTFEIADGETVTSGYTLNSGQTGTINSGGTLSVSSGSDPAITVKGSADIVNNGTIVNTVARAIRVTSGADNSLTLTITNNEDASITATSDDAIQVNKSDTNVTLYNYGTITSGSSTSSGGQSIDWNAIQTGTNILYNYSTGIIQAYDADAVRPGVNGVIYNDGVIQSIYSTESNDGIDAQTNSGVTIINASNGSETEEGTGEIIGSKNGIAGGAADSASTFTITVTNNKGGTIEGQDGSGINIDGYNANSTATVYNYGTIIGNGVTKDGDGIDVDGVLYLVNTGTIISYQSYEDTSEGVSIGGGTIVNSGLIEGDNTDGGVGVGITIAGVDKDADGNAIDPEGIYADTIIDNSGTIRGQSGSAIQITGGETTHTVTITNEENGLIEGGGATAAVISTGVTSTTIINYGTIEATESSLAIDFGSSDSSLEVLGGSAKIIGDINGGTGTSTVTITPGAGNSFTYDYSMYNLHAVTIGEGTTILTGISTYTGATTIDEEGTLSLSGLGSIAYSSGVTNNGTFDISATDDGASVTSLSGTGSVVLGSQTLTLTDAEGTFSGVISGAGGLTISGGTETLSGDNTYTGTTTIQHGAGLVLSGTIAGDVDDAGALTLDGGVVAGAITDSGTLSVTADGAAAGTLQGSGAISLSGTLTLTAASGEFSGNISGTGNIVISTDGTYVLSGDSNYSGGTGLLSGTLTVSSDTALGSGTLAMSEGTTLVLDGDGLTLANAITLSGDPYISVGSGDTATISGVISDGTEAGDLVKTGGGTLILTAENTYSGPTEVAEGTLSVNGSIANSTVTVDDGATLSGIGTVGTTTIGSGGTLAPGNSIGTLTVAGDLTFASGSIYAVEIGEDGESDRVDVSGNLYIDSGAQVSVVYDSSLTYSSDWTYTILTYGGTRTGTFAAIEDSILLSYSLNYDDDNKEVELAIALKEDASGDTSSDDTGTDSGSSDDSSSSDSSTGGSASDGTATDDTSSDDDSDSSSTDSSLAQFAGTSNELATAKALDSLGQTSTLWTNVASVADEATARSAFNQLSGASHASTKSALVGDSQFVRDAINNRIRAAFDGVAAPSEPTVPVLNYGPEIIRTPKDAPFDKFVPAEEKYTVWASAFGSWGKQKGGDGVGDVDSATGGFLIGTDWAIAENWRFGLLTGYSRSTFDTSNSDGQSDNYHIGAYAGGQWNAFSFRSGLSFTHHEIETSRSVAFDTVLGGFSDSTSADYTGSTVQGFGEVAYRIDTAAASFEPYANLSHVWLKTDGFTENGGSAALAVNEETVNTTFTTLGFRVSSGFGLRQTKAVARGGLGWRHAFGDVDPTSTQAFVAGGDAFTVTGTPIAKDSAVIDAGLDFNITPATTLGLSYQGQVSSDAYENGVNAKFRVNF